MNIIVMYKPQIMQYVMCLILYWVALSKRNGKKTNPFIPQPLDDTIPSNIQHYYTLFIKSIY